MQITLFKSKPTKGKYPISPYGDLTYDFEVIECNALDSMFRVMVNNFILNVTLNKNIHTFRRKSYLKEYYPKTFDYLIIDIDEVKTRDSVSKILKYFKKYKCIIGESRSYNGVDNFNLKGILCIEPLDIANLKICVEQLKTELEQYGKFDVAVARQPSLNAPIFKHSVLLENEKGILYKFIYKPSYNSKSLDNILNGDFQIPEKLDLENVKSIDELCLKVFVQMGFTCIKQNDKCLMFSHPTEKKTPGGYFWFKDSPFIMHHYNVNKSINIFYKVKDMPEAKEFLNKKIDYLNVFETNKLNYFVYNINIKTISMEPQLNSLITKFLNNRDGLFAIKSPMGTGKSVIISEIIKNALELDLRILICTNRISVANDFKNKYNLKIYNADKYKLNDSIIVQYDSLWHYNVNSFDLVIFDEFISLLLHSRNSLNNISINIAKFFACFNKKLVIADAFLTGYENIFFNFKRDNLFFINNEYRDSVELYQYNDYNCFIQSVLIHAKKHKLTISCTSLNTIHALKMLLESYNIRTITLTAETPQCTKELIYKLFKESNNDKYDVLIYSPTLTVGVSNLNEVDYHFHYDSSSACDVISSLQMIKRTRKAKEIHLYIKNKINYLKTTYKEIRDEYTENLCTESEYNYFFDFTDYGEMRLSKLGERAIYIDLFKNIIEYNHKNAFEYFLDYQFDKKCVIIEKMFTTNILLPYIKKVKSDNKQYMENALEEYLMLSEYDRKTILDLKKQNLFDVFEEIENSLIEDCPIEMKTEILKKQLYSNFIQKLKNYKLLISSKEDIKSYISECLIKNHSEVKFWNEVLKFKDSLKSEYLPNELTPKIKNILSECGYTMNKDVINKFTVNADIENYKDWIK